MQPLFKKNALKKRQVPPREFFVLVRARADVGLLSHVGILWLLFSVAYLSLNLFGIILVLIAKGALPFLWKDFLQTWPQVLLGLIGQTSNMDDPRIRSIYGWLSLWLLFFGCLWFIRRLIKDFRGLRTIARAQASGEATIPIRKYLHVRATPWLYGRVVDAPSPTALLDFLQQEHSWSQSLAEILQQAPEEKRPPVTILISLSDHLAISIMGQDGKQEPIEFKNPTWNAVLAFFALQNKGEWVPRKTIERKVYGAEQGDLLALHTSRINAQVNRVAEDLGFFDEPVFEEEPGNIDLFEQDRSDPRHLWRLSPRCEVEIFSGLMALNEQVLAAQSGQAPLHRDVLRRRCHQVIEQYGKGLLAEHQEPPCVWPWLHAAYIGFRDQLCFILEYAASCEWQTAQEQAHSDRTECQDAIWYSARFSGLRALIALGMISKPDAGEAALICALERYYLLKDIDAASSVYQAYVKRMLERDSRWTPRLKILEIWPEATRRQRKKKRVSKA